MSISKWFGGVSESSSDEEDDDGDMPGTGMALGMDSGAELGLEGVGGDETPRFSGTRAGQGSVLADESESEGEAATGDGVIPVPGGERVSRADIAAGTMADESRKDDARRYSPPQQDGS